uniref:Sigma-like factor n=1 Tax=Andalucia godoyi TaxID=505711 RepID=M4Q9A1_ANDGO|nr:sigma-like factor [Andalucia godoyi]AGH23997.1 sigma-like factor [Andalucia godoyi]
MKRNQVWKTELTKEAFELLQREPIKVMDLPIIKKSKPFPFRSPDWFFQKKEDFEISLRQQKKEYVFSMLHKRNQNFEMTFSPEEENILLSAYEKNTVRIFFFLCQNPSFAWQIQRYFFFFFERLESDSQNLFLSKMKQWMNLEIFQSHYRYHEMERFLPEANLWEMDALSLLQKEYLEKWKIKDNHEKIKMNSLGTHLPLISLFRRILQSYLLFYRLQPKISCSFLIRKSVFLEYFEKELLSEVLAQFKILHITESWTMHTVSFLRSYTKTQKDFLFQSHLRPFQPGLFYQVFLQFDPAFQKRSSPSFLSSSNSSSWTPLKIQHWFEQSFQFFLSNVLLFEQDPKRIQFVSEQIQSDLYRLFLTFFPMKSDFDQKPSLKERQWKESLLMNLCRYEIQKKKQTISNVEYLLKISKHLKYTIAQDHIRLVMSVAKNHKYRNMEMSDLLQEGLLGLTKAVERFELDRGYQFTTYATWWVHQALNRVTLNGNQMIPIPTHLQRKIHTILSTSSQLAKQLSREPYLEEIAQKLKIPVQKVYQFLQTSMFSTRLVSLDQKLGSNENRSYLHFLHTPNPRPNVQSRNEVESWIFSEFSPKMATLFKMMYGVGPFEKHSLEELSEFFSLSQKRMRFLYKEGMKKLQEMEKKIEERNGENWE